jgi:hypothetical protein
MAELLHQYREVARQGRPSYTIVVRASMQVGRAPLDEPRRRLSASSRSKSGDRRPDSPCVADPYSEDV